MLGLIFIIAGIVCFALDGFRVRVGKLALFPLGWAFLATAVLLLPKL
jgi:hypothetical protein